MNSARGGITVNSRHDFYPYGGEHTTASTEEFNVFTQQERDDESGLDNFWFRKYQSISGRWTSPDPLFGNIGNPQSLNRYGYVLGNPTNLIDPLGLHTCPPGFESSFQGPGGPHLCRNISSDSHTVVSLDVWHTGSDPPSDAPAPEPNNDDVVPRAVNCALAYYGIDPVSVMGRTTSIGKWGLIAAGAGGIPKGLPETLGLVRTVRLPGSSGFTSAFSVGSAIGRGGALRTVANFASKVAVPIAIASAVIDATAIGICTAWD